MAKSQKPKTPTVTERLSKIEDTLAQLLETMSKFQNLDAVEQTNGREEASIATKETPTLEEANGRVEETELERTKRAEELLGVNHTNPWGTTDPDIFDQFLDNATQADLQAKAREVGMSPYSTYHELKGNLRNAFRRDNKQAYGAVKTPQVSKKGVTLDKNNPQHLEVMKMLGMQVSSL